MRIYSASNRQPDWVDSGYRDYEKRFRGPYSLELIEVKLVKRTTAPIEQAVADEGRRMLDQVPTSAHVVALDERADIWSTEDLVNRMTDWLTVGMPVCFLIGGPDGLAPACFARANERWSLSRLTLPHGIVRVVAAEALYRAASVIEGHPYHRN